MRVFLIALLHRRGRRQRWRPRGPGLPRATRSL